MYRLIFHVTVKALIAATFIVTVSACAGLVHVNENLRPHNNPLVMYKGRLVPLADLEARGPTACHDLAGPGLTTCFDTAKEMEEDVARRERQLNVPPLVPTPTTTD